MKHTIHCISVFANRGVHHGKYRHQPVQKLAQIFVGLQLMIFKPREFYSIEYSQFNPWVDNHATRCIKFCVFLSKDSDIELHVPVYQNAHVNIVCEKVYCIRCLFYFSSVPRLTFINTKGNMCLKNSSCFWWIETLILSLHVSWINKVTLSMGIYQLRYGALRFSLTPGSHTCKWAYLSSFLIQKSF